MNQINTSFRMMFVYFKKVIYVIFQLVKVRYIGFKGFISVLSMHHIIVMLIDILYVITCISTKNVDFVTW